MARLVRSQQPSGMRFPTSSPFRPPDNELYDRGCDLVEAATAMRSAAALAQAAPAAPAALGCIEAAVHELRLAIAALEKTATGAMPARSRPSEGAAIERAGARMRRGFASLQQALTDTQSAASAARSLTARALTAASSAETGGTP